MNPKACLGDRGFDGWSRRRFILALGGAASAAVLPAAALAQGAQPFERWVAAFRARARTAGISDATYTRVTAGMQPDKGVFALVRAQPEFTEKLWQYLNRRISEWRIVTGVERGKEHSALLERISRDYGVDRHVLLALWGVESSYGEVITNPKYMRPVFPALAALAWGEPRRRRYWEQEFLNALRVVERGWSTPQEMTGSWAGAMGHTQWMPEVWLNIGVDYDRDGRINPFGRPDDALASSASYLVKRGRYRRGEGWGHEVRKPAAIRDGKTVRSYDAWRKLGVVRADDKPFPNPAATARLWAPEAGGPAFLLGQNFSAVRSYNPSNAYTLAIVHLADRIRGGGPFVQQFPGGERALTLAEIQEVQRRLSAQGFDTKGADGRVGTDTMRAVRAFQQRVGLSPADGYTGLKVLARLRQGS